MAKAKSATPQPGTTKKPCPISRADFGQHATAMVIDLGGQAKVVAMPKNFSTGSFGWGFNDKVTVVINGVPVKLQGTINLTVVGSKDQAE